MSTSLRRKKLLLNIPSALARTPPPRHTMSARPRLSPRLLERHHQLLNTWCHVLLQAPHPKSRRRHLHLWETRKDDHPLPRLLRTLLTRIFLRRVFKTRRQSTRINTSSSSLTDSKFGALLLKAKAHLLSNSPRTSISSANPRSSLLLPPSKGTHHIQPSSRPPTLGKQPSSTSPHYTSVAVQATPPQPSTFHLVTWYTPFGPLSMRLF
jgi:hypothetical protein